MANMQEHKGVAPAAGIKTWRERIQGKFPNAESEYWPGALRVSYMEDEIADLRAALLHAHAAIYAGVADPAAPQPSAEPAPAAVSRALEAYMAARAKHEHQFDAMTAALRAVGTAAPAAPAVAAEAVRAAALEEAARACEKIAEERFAEYGIRESDTGATYYSGTRAEELDTRDEEDADCAAAIRALAAQPAPADPMDWPLPCKIDFGNNVFVDKGATLRTLQDFIRARLWLSGQPAPAPLNGQQVGEVCESSGEHDARVVLNRDLPIGTKLYAAPLNSVSEQDAKDAALAEAAAVFESAAKHNESKGRTVFAHEQRERANRMRAAMTATPSSQKGTADE